VVIDEVGPQPVPHHQYENPTLGRATKSCGAAGDEK